MPRFAGRRRHRSPARAARQRAQGAHALRRSAPPPRTSGVRLARSRLPRRRGPQSSPLRPSSTRASRAGPRGRTSPPRRRAPPRDFRRRARGARFARGTLWPNRAPPRAPLRRLRAKSAASRFRLPSTSWRSPRRRNRTTALRRKAFRDNRSRGRWHRGDADRSRRPSPSPRPPARRRRRRIAAAPRPRRQLPRTRP